MKRILMLILKTILKYAVSAGMVALGWNVFLVRAFDNISKLNAEQILLFTLALPFVFYPVTIAVSERVMWEIKNENKDD